MKGSPVKLGIVVGLAVIGIITLATAFDFGGAGVPQGAVVVVAPSPATTEPAKSPKPKPSPDLVQGIHVGVYNGTKVTGEAAMSHRSSRSRDTWWMRFSILWTPRRRPSSTT